MVKDPQSGKFSIEEKGAGMVEVSFGLQMTANDRTLVPPS